MDIRALLNRDFGYDPKISGGTGKKDDPIRLESMTLTDAANTEMKILTSIGIGRNVLWRVLEREMVDHAERVIELVRLHVRWFEKTEVVTLTESYYFDLTETGARATTLSMPSIHLPRAAWTIPFELGWLHFQSITDNESRERGAGCTLTYGASGAKATIFVYEPNGTTRGVSGSLHAEMMAATDDIRKSHPDIESLGEPSPYGPFSLRSFLAGEDASLLAIAERGTSFIKVRLTFVDGLEMRQMVGESLRALATVIERIPG